MKYITGINSAMNISVDLLCSSLHIPRATYYRHQHNKKNNNNQLIKARENVVSEQDKQKILNLLHSEHYVDKTPYELYYDLLDKGEYYCSPRTMYRFLALHSETKDRRQQRNHRDAIKPELMATKQNEVWSWDITKLLSQKKFVYYYLYVIIDIFSRYVVGWLIADHESKEIAHKLIQQSTLKHGIQPQQLTLHADNGPSMISHTVAQLLEHLGISKTHNRPYKSNDNPFSESQFKTMKYRPEFPERFASLQHGEAFCQQFFSWYNNEHYHSGIAWLTPVSVHYNKAKDILEQRYAVLMNAFVNNPIRFNNKVPKLKKLPNAVYINPPQTIAININQKINKKINNCCN